jgi:hypothetical protein
MLSTTALMVCLLVANASDSACTQPATERNRLIDEAQRSEFTVRRVEFIGLTYTHDHLLRDRMTPIVNEGDVFTRDKLVRSLRSMNLLRRAIYPLRLENVVIQLDTSDSTVDMIICFRQRPRRVVKPPANPDESGLVSRASH